MERKLIELLKTLEERFPPRTCCHHALTYNRYGSEETGWIDKLGLHIARESDGLTQTMFLEEGDLDKPVPVLIEEIEQILFIQSSDVLS